MGKSKPAAAAGGAKGGSTKGGGEAGGGGGAAGGACSQVKLRHILCEKHGKCLEALQKIQAGGERFEQVCVPRAARGGFAARAGGGGLGWV